MLLAAIALLLLSGAADWLSLDLLKARRIELRALVEARPVLVASVFFLLYVLVTALSIPGAVVMTLAAGAMFDLWLGVALVSFASTLGATLAFLGSRYLFSSWVRDRYGARLAAMDAGIERDGQAYLLALRLNPVIPFFLVNLAMGLTRMPAARFALVSQAGMLPATFVYVLAGTELGRIGSLSDIATPPVIGSLLLLSLFPLVGRWAARALARRRLYRRWRRPRRFDRNLVVIGAGAGGLVTSLVGSAIRARVTLIEAGAMGGDCLNTGCVPSKALIRAARTAHEMRNAARFGLRPSPPETDLGAVMRRLRGVIARIAPNDSVERYRSLGVDVRTGHGRIVDPWTVEVNGDRLTSRAIVIATGAEPVIPLIPGIEASPVVTSETLWARLEAMERLPERLAVLGGGPIGVELAQAFQRLGSRVVLVEAEDRLLPREEEKIGACIRAALEADGVEIRTGWRAECADACSLTIVRGEARERVEMDLLLAAVGRRPRLAGYGLEELGLVEDGRLVTDSKLRTRLPNIYAVGDVQSEWQFTHAASHQAWHAAVNGLFAPFWSFRVDHGLLPRVTFTDPEVARIGLDAAEAEARGLAVEIVDYDLAELDRAIAEDAERGFVRLVLAAGTDRIIGATLVGPQAGELVMVVALAMRRKAGLRTLLSTIHPYPTMAEALRAAAGQWRRRHQPERLLALLAAFHRWRRG